MADVTPHERLFGILETLVRFDLGDVKDAYTREKIIDARDLAREIFHEELRAPKAALVETFPTQLAAE